MENFTITKEQIIQLHSNSNAGYDQLVMADLKKWFPDAFKKELENGKAYKGNGFVLYKTSNNSGFGFNTNDNNSFHRLCSTFIRPKDWREYPLEDFKKLLIAEADKRGFKVDSWIDRKPLGFNANDRIVKIDSDKFPDDSGSICYTSEQHGFFIECNGFVIFNNGIWAKIID